VTALRPPRSSDVGPFVSAFEQEAELAELLGFEVDPTADYMKERLRRHRRVLRDGRSVSFTIADRGNDEFLGEVLLHTFDWQHSRAALGIWLRREARGSGRALDAMRMICDYGFDELALARIEFTTFPTNRAMVALGEKAGFKVEGTLRSYTMERGKRRDLLMLSLLPGELR
jgi:RimJ/RimL family protein N-acetyltransferase